MTDSSFYKSNREHLADELLKLDALLQLRVLKHREVFVQKESDLLRGLYITEEDVDRVTGLETSKKPANAANEKRVQTLLYHLNKCRQTIDKKVENSLKKGINLPFYYLTALFHLYPFEWDTLLICLAPELDLKYQKIYSYLQDDVTQKKPTVAFVLNLLCKGFEEEILARTIFSSQSALIKHNLIDFTDEIPNTPLIERTLKMDDRIVDFLLGFHSLDKRLDGHVRLVEPEKDWSSVVLHEDVKKKLIRLSGQFFKKRDNESSSFYFWGPYGAGKKLAAEAFCKETELPLIIVNTGELLKKETDFEKIISHLFREALLQPAAIYMEDFDILYSHEHNNVRYQRTILEAIDEYSILTFLSGRCPWHPSTLSTPTSLPPILVEFPVPSYPHRKRLWQMSLNRVDQIRVSPQVDVEVLANKFRMTGGQIRDAFGEARNLALMRSPDGDGMKITTEDLYNSCRAQSNQKLSQMAKKMKPHYAWPDIVLPEDQLKQLKEIQNYVKYRHVVFHEWGFEQKLSLGKGLNVLFSGSSGTGKTMAADIIANELHLDYYKIDLSSVVSKYIGETEKNLAAVFREAETSNAILFFDEADALFGKRSEVKDAHDRYANIEIGYLLQKMEEYEGVVILATNMRNNLDEAFVRRMHFTVDFPFPDEDSRLRIWQNIFPDETPLDRNIDFDFLKKNFKITGGNIKNIALAAAFYAADDGKAVTMEHLVQAGKREFQKMGKLCVKEDFGKYYELINRHKP